LMAMLDRIVTMDKPAVSFYTPLIKQHSKQWLGKVMPGLRPKSIPLGRSKWCWPSLKPRASSTQTSCPGENCQCPVHHGGPYSLLEDFQAEEARDGGRGLVVPLG
jgi:hypothetical protein